MGKVLQLYNGEAEKLYGRRDGVRASWIARHSMPMPSKASHRVRLLQGRPGSSQTLILQLGTVYNKDVYQTIVKRRMLYYDYYSDTSYIHCEEPFLFAGAGVTLLFFVMVLEHIGSLNDIECYMIETDVSSYQHHRYRYNSLALQVHISRARKRTDL